MTFKTFKPTNLFFLFAIVISVVNLVVFRIELGKFYLDQVCTPVPYCEKVSHIKAFMISGRVNNTASSWKNVTVIDTNKYEDFTEKDWNLHLGKLYIRFFEEVLSTGENDYLILEDDVLPIKENKISDIIHYSRMNDIKFFSLQKTSAGMCSYRYGTTAFYIEHTFLMELTNMLRVEYLQHNSTKGIDILISERYLLYAINEPLTQHIGKRLKHNITLS